MAKFLDVRDPQSRDICYCSHTRNVHGGERGRWKCYGSERCACEEFAFSWRAPELEEKLYAVEKAARELKQPDRFTLDMLNRAVEAARSDAGRSIKIDQEWVIKRSRFTDADGVVREFTPEFAAREAERAGRTSPCRHPLLRVKSTTSVMETPCALCGERVNMPRWLAEQPRGAFLAAADYAANQVAMQTLPPELQAPRDPRMFILCRCTHRRDFHINDEWECRYSGCECGMFVEAEEKRAPQAEKPAPPMLFSDLTRKFWKDED